MNEAREPAPIDPADESWRDLDDTLADGPAPAEVPAGARAWLADQRLLHGLLRALHTADAPARESRIHAVMDRIDADGAVAPQRWWLVAAAALLFATLGVWLVLPDRLPTAEAAMGRAVAELSRDVDRRFRVEVVATTHAGKVMHSDLLLVTRPGMRFRIDGKLSFGSFELGEFRIGCDGEEIWILPANGAFRRAGPLAERERLLQGVGDVLDLGYLDVHDLVQKLPADFDLAVVGREQNAAGPQLRIEAVRRAGSGERPRSAWLLCDEATGMVTRVETEVELGRGATRRLSLQYLGEEPAGLVDYRRPW
jgi:hypothetical protein